MGGELVGVLLDWLPLVDYVTECIYAQMLIIMVLLGLLHWYLVPGAEK
jgi:hypothetical protein